MNKKPILSICIPTYNRANVLKGSLECIEKQLQDIDMSELEIYVSDNCSPDNTQDVVYSFINRGAPLVYNRNTENLKAAGNFLQCMTWASGKYIYLLGDDDYLKPGAIKLLLDTLRGKEYGVLYLNTQTNCNAHLEDYNDLTIFVKNVSYYFTFMSGCIFRKDIVKQIEDPIRYKPSHLLQMPFYIKSAMSFEKNAVLSCEDLLQVGVVSNSNGGYNFFDVFVHWYLEIWREYLHDKKLLAWLKKDIWLFVWMYTKKLLIKKNVGNFKTENGWRILLKYYGNEWYFWWTLVKYPFGVVKRKIKKLL